MKGIMKKGIVLAFAVVLATAASIAAEGTISHEEIDWD